MAQSDEILKRAEDNFVSGINNIGAIWGLNSVESKIIGYLLTQDRSVSLNALVDSLKISKGNISVSIRKLEEKQIVKKAWVKGDRKDYYEPTMDLWQVFLKKLRENFRLESITALEIIDETMKIIQGSFNKMSNDASDRARNFMQRLQKMKNYYTLADEIGRSLENETRSIDIQKIRLLWGTLKGHLKTTRK